MRVGSDPDEVFEIPRVVPTLARTLEDRVGLRQPAAPWSPVAMARTWLARWGWRRHGLIDEREAPRRS